jgi:hypothetical protein
MRIGEERAVHLPPLETSAGHWTYHVEGMESAVQVRKLWAADPYPEDDEDEDAEHPQPDTVFMVRGAAPGTTILRFVPRGVATTALAQIREIQVTVRM